VNRHFHCTRPNCGYTFVRYSTMALHEQKHRDESGQQSVNSSMSSSQLHSSLQDHPEASSPPPQSSSPLSGSSVSSGTRKIKQESPSLASSQSDIAALKTGKRSVFSTFFIPHTFYSGALWVLSDFFLYICACFDFYC
jgi:hypothetical protein